VASIPVLEGAEWLVIIGPIFLTFLLLFITGIPMLEVCVFLVMILLQYSPFSERPYDIKEELGYILCFSVHLNIGFIKEELGYIHILLCFLFLF
jgi:hypothetical protein